MQAVGAAHHVEVGAQAVAAHVLRVQVGTRRETVTHHRAVDPGEDGAHVRIVHAQHRQAVERQVVQERDEARLELLEVAVVRAEMIVVDVGDDGDHRVQVQERRVALVGLRHQVLAGAEPRVGARALEPAADHEGRVLAALGEDRRRQAGGGGLAVRAGHGDGVAEAHQLTEHLGARHHGNALAQRRHHLGVVVGHRARGDHDVGVADVLRGVTEHDPGAEPRQALGDGVRFEVAALHLVTQVEQHLGDAAHAAAADAHEVDAMDAAHAIAHAASICS
jgi:hypothetical protein